jgi:hypothetical protein
VAAAIAVVAVQKEGLHQPIRKHEKECHAKVAKLPVVVVAAKKAATRAEVEKAVNLSLGKHKNAWIFPGVFVGIFHRKNKF